MIYDITMLGLGVALCLICIYLGVRQKKLIRQMGNLALELVKLDTKVDSIDKATGADVFKLRRELEEFKTDYGEAAIEEMRQSAKREKAWADGVNSIMSYGARYQDQR